MINKGGTLRSFYLEMSSDKLRVIAASNQSVKLEMELNTFHIKALSKVHRSCISTSDASGSQHTANSDELSIAQQ